MICGILKTKGVGLRNWKKTLLSSQVFQTSLEVCYTWYISTTVKEKQHDSNKPHKHKDLIIAYANGAEIEYCHRTDNEWYGIANPGWHEHVQYRIKPEPKSDVVKYVFVEEKPSFCNIFNDNNLKLTFCGETGKLKSAEVIN